MIRVAIVGAGSWGTTLAYVAGTNGHEVALWSRDPDVARGIRTGRANPRSAPGLELPPGVDATTDLRAAVGGAELVLVVVPAQSFRAVARDLAPALSPEQTLLHATKGLELGTHRRMTQILAEETCAKKVGVISGPNIAEEIARGEPAGTVVASPLPNVVRLGRELLGSPRLLVFSGTDVTGVEICGALKNIVAIAAGIADGLGLGENAKALLVARGLAEMERLGSVLGAEAPTITGLAGLGDLVATCRSVRSRNHRVGEALARGEPLADVVARLGMVAEGVPTSIAARDLATAHGVACPLFVAIHDVLHEGLAPTDAIDALFRLPAGRDVSWS